MATASETLKTSCSLCNSTENLNRCAGCKVVQYCSRDHQTLDWPSHRPSCVKVKKAFQKLNQEEETLRNHPGDFLTPANPFVNGVGHFWGHLDTRDYMRARYAYIESVLKFNTHRAVETALEHLMDMFRLCRGDNMGLRYITPHCFLRLGQDQECYDFIKWWVTCDPKGEYDWGDMTLPYLNIKDADVFEPIDVFLTKFPSISFLAAITLLKIRLLIDLQSLQRTRKEVGALIPQEVLDSIQSAAVGSIVSKNKRILEREDHTAEIKDLQAQIQKSFDRLTKANKHFWPAIVKPGNNLTIRPQAYGMGSVAEMQIMLQYCYSAWAETPGAIGVIEELLKN
ncbi:hypothetical protein TWF694_004712 [Orbilia ellipsospora]|uniref:MYND-type domain-containing protein n=1 Tax=Orbilia ellipsospora TaxID=2528407 RepID=A0AAV9WX25_9PEZI